MEAYVAHLVVATIMSCDTVACARISRQPNKLFHMLVLHALYFLQIEYLVYICIHAGVFHVTLLPWFLCCLRMTCVQNLSNESGGHHQRRQNIKTIGGGGASARGCKEADNPCKTFVCKGQELPP